MRQRSTSRPPSRPGRGSTFYIPSACGDVRLLSREGTAAGSRLEIENLTPLEWALLQKVIPRFRAKGWLPKDYVLPDVPFTERIEVLLDAPVADVGALLLGAKAPPRGVLLGVVYSGGTRCTVEGPIEGEDLLALVAAEAALPPEEVKPPEATPEAGKTGLTAGEGQEALTPTQVETPKPAVVVTPRPTLCCPVPVPGPIERRASEVLRAFCSPEQWGEWVAEGMLHCRGSLTGDTYRIVHRNHPLAARQGKVTWNETTDHVVHCHVSQLPPPEEVLSILLTLEWGEAWIRNPSGYFGPGGRFPHPLGLGAGEGIPSASWVSSFPDLVPALALGMSAGGLLQGRS